MPCSISIKMEKVEATTLVPVFSIDSPSILKTWTCVGHIAPPQGALLYPFYVKIIYLASTQQSRYKESSPNSSHYLLFSVKLFFLSLTHTHKQNNDPPTIWVGHSYLNKRAIRLYNANDHHHWDTDHGGKRKNPSQADCPVRVCVDFVIGQWCILDQRKDKAPLWRRENKTRGRVKEEILASWIHCSLHTIWYHWDPEKEGSNWSTLLSILNHGKTFYI